MPKEWTAEERAAAGKRLKDARARKQQLKQTTQFIVEPGTLTDEMIAEPNKPGKLIAMPNEHLDLLKWVARSITTINMAGKKMTNKCSLCAVSRLHKEPCRHDEVWRLAGQ